MTRPASTVSSALMVRIKVDFPAPLRPMIPKVSPRLTCRSTPSSAATEPKARRTESSRTMASVLISADHAVAEAFHFLELRAELQQQQVDAHFFELADLLLHLGRRTHQAGAQTAIRHRIFLDRHLLFQLGAFEPLLVIG